jgi:murein endopeptidase
MGRFVVLFAVVALTSSAEARHHTRPKHSKVVRRTARLAELPVRGQSIGWPWLGRLNEPTRLPDGKGYHIRRPWRAYGTRTTVELVERVLHEWRHEFPEAHVLAIGDLSAEHGGQITEHHSHQSGRDADIGLIYNEKPRGYPDSFVDANANNLDCEATFALIEAFAATANEDGGVQMMFLDFDVQGILVRWAEEHGVSDEELGRLFQYPHGRGSMAGLVHHVPNHQNHLHVRFKCASADRSCQ